MLGLALADIGRVLKEILCISIHLEARSKHDSIRQDCFKVITKSICFERCGRYHAASAIFQAAFLPLLSPGFRGWHGFALGAGQFTRRVRERMEVVRAEMC